MFNTNLPIRQIHLDFHTSEHCQDIGAEFSEEQFTEALKIGKVQSINFFACCHHGWTYYPNSTLGIDHPHLKTDLVGGMLSACRKAGVNAVVYITVGWNDRAARLHPEWCIRKPDGSFENCPKEEHPNSPRPFTVWKRMCLNTAYLDEVLSVTRDVMERYNPPGMWFDITPQSPCMCDKCVSDMIAQGLDPNKPEDRKYFADQVYIRYLKAVDELIWGINKNTTIYHNQSSLKARYDLYPYNSHFEIESLPTGGWGYDHFPPNARYFTQLPAQVVGMTGKFHKSWGEFGGFKNPVALKYECAQIVSLGCLVCTGDQLHPSGKMDMETYRIIGEAYDYVEKNEPWLVDAKPIADVAILGTMEMFQQGNDKAITGAGKMLMEAHIPHAIIDETMEFDAFKLLVVPDYGRLDAGVRDKLNRFLAKGGKLLLSYQSGVAMDKWDFALDLGAKCLGPSQNDVEYLEVTDKISANMVTSPILLYNSGLLLEPAETTTILAHRRAPMFNRTWGHFSSHKNTPFKKERMTSPAAIQKDGIIYIANPIFSMYDKEGMKLHRDFVINCLNLIYPIPLFKCNLPSCGRVAITRQEKENRDLIHLMYATPTKRGNVEVIEDIIPIANVKVAYKTDRRPKKIYVTPEQNELLFTYVNKTLEFTLPTLDMAQIVAVEY